MITYSSVSQGAHVTINARSEMDLDEDEVLKKVSTASGAKFSVHKEKARPMPQAGPIVSSIHVYHTVFTVF